VNSWIDRANWHWFELWKALPEDQRAGVPRMPPGMGLSTNAADATMKKEPKIVEAANAWAEREWKAWHDSGRKGPLPEADSAAAHESLGMESKICLANLTSYYTGFATLPASKLKRGGAHGFIKSDGEINAFAIGHRMSTPRELFLEIARGHGGDHMAVWTFGHALHVLVARSPKPGARVTQYGPFSVRARVPRGTKRASGFVEGLTSALEGSAFHPDFAALRTELAKPEISVAKCFEALGLAGARDFASPDTAALWADYEAVAQSLLSGEAADKKRLKNVQEILKPLADSTKLPSKGKLGKGVTARAVADAAAELAGVLGVPESSAWAKRNKAAECYWDICDGEALGRLTSGTDKAGIGTSAAVARLLTHFPDELSRDPLFHAVLALECEAANGHVYVEPLCILAEQAAAAGLVLVIAPHTQRAAMRAALGITAENPEAGPGGAWCGEALICGTTITKGDPADVARNWMAKAKATGAVAELAADGTTKVDWYKDGAAAKKASDAGLGPVNEAALKKAAKDFLPRAGFVALGAGDVLEPGEWKEGAHSGDAPAGTEDHRARKKRHAQKLLSSSVEPQPLRHFGELREMLGSRLKYEGPLKEAEGGIVSLRLALPLADEAWLRELRNDWKGRGVIHLYGDAWVEGGELRGYTCSDLDVALFAQLLGDAPAGTIVSIGVGNEMKGCWRIG